jgi:hypothetical protein
MNCKTRDYTFPVLKRKDGEEFAITARLFELPPTDDYWLARFQATHATWNHMGFVMTIPKSIAAIADLAEVMVQGSGLQQVESLLQQATASGRPLTLTKSLQGWTLV